MFATLNISQSLYAGRGNRCAAGQQWGQQASQAGDAIVTIRQACARVVGEVDHARAEGRQWM
ncbi:hypothetical protein [Pseudomonas sp.]|uniref:hypothetical protein n=1 Tax=Pseudomonas sp. TaxID=306 RepID=UPI003A974A3B